MTSGNGRVAAALLSAALGVALAARGDERGPDVPPSSPASGADDATSDVVERIDDGNPTTSESPKPQVFAATAPANEERFSLRGFLLAQGIAGLGKAGDPLPNGAPSPLTVPYDGLHERTQLFLELKFARKGAFEAVVSGLAGYDWYDREVQGSSGPFDNLHAGQSRGTWDPQLREAYAGVYWSRLDLRLGQQRLAWGRADSRSPNDVLNAYDLRDPLLLEQELTHLPTPLARVDLDLGAVTLQLVGSPVFVPDRFDVYGSNWALVQPGSPALFRGLLGVAARAVDPAEEEALQPLLSATTRPKGNLTEPTGGARLAIAFPGVDFDAYYHYGFDGLPNLQFDPRAAAALSQVNLAEATPGSLLSALGQLGGLPFTSTYVRRHHLGFDLQTTVGPFALRLDAGHDSAKVFFNKDLTGFVSKAFEGVLSVEYQTGDIGKTIIVELTGLHLSDPPPTGGLLFHKQDLLGLAGVARWTFADRLELELRGEGSARPQSFLVRPQIALKFERFWIKAGAVLVAGAAGSLGDYYQRNDSLYVTLKQSL